MQKFIEKASITEYCKEIISVGEAFFSINNNGYFFLVLCFYMVCYEISYFFMSYRLNQDLSNKKKVKKSVEEIKKELLESIAKERSEDVELINKPDNVLALQDALECVKQYEKHLQKEKKKNNRYRLQSRTNITSV